MKYGFLLITKFIVEIDHLDIQIMGGYARIRKEGGMQKQKSLADLRAQEAAILAKIEAAEKAEKEKIGAWVMGITGLENAVEIKENI